MPTHRDPRTIGQPPTQTALLRLSHVAERVGMDTRTAEAWLRDRFGFEVIPVGSSGTRYVRRVDADRLMAYLGVPADVA